MKILTERNPLSVTRIEDFLHPQTPPECHSHFDYKCRQLDFFYYVL